jgi:hypothetical protein
MPEGYDNSYYCFGHFEFVGFKMNSSYICERGQDPNEVNDFKRVYSGHFHTPSEKGNIQYLGSPYAQTFHDVDSTRGYYIFDDGELEFIEFTYAPKFMKVDTDNITQENIKGNIVKLIFVEDKGSINNQQIIDEALSFNPVKLIPDFSQIKIEGTEDKQDESVSASLLDHNEIIDEYVGKIEIPEHVKRKTVLTMMRKLRGEE